MQKLVYYSWHNRQGIFKHY